MRLAYVVARDPPRGDDEPGAPRSAHPRVGLQRSARPIRGPVGGARLRVADNPRQRDRHGMPGTSGRASRGHRPRRDDLDRRRVTSPPAGLYRGDPCRMDRRRLGTRDQTSADRRGPSTVALGPRVRHAGRRSPENLAAGTRRETCRAHRGPLARDEPVLPNYRERGGGDRRDVSGGAERRAAAAAPPAALSGGRALRSRPRPSRSDVRRGLRTRAGYRSAPERYRISALVLAIRW